MRIFCFFIVLFLVQSCIPIKTLPRIKEDKIFYGKTLKRDLPKTHFLVFKDPKDAYEFYDFINYKYDLNHVDVGRNVPINIDGNNYYLSYREVEREVKTLNLLPIAIDAALTKGESDPLGSIYTSRKGHWYIAMSIHDEDFNDALKPAYKNRKAVADYLRGIRKEYLTTANYKELLFKKKRP